ncbi:MAG: threonine synthase [Verrucomicrobia bacterium]|nr:threonine synthase [Verrucomicrobiota bacterium]
MFLTDLVCGLCGQVHRASEIQTVCRACGRPLLARYDLTAAGAALQRGWLAGREPSLWRYRELLPLPAEALPVTLGEGWTPLLPVPRWGGQLGLERVWVKDESQNPTATFKARGMAVAVSMARHFGLKILAAPSAGNAGGALAAYAARAGMNAHLFMPRDTPKANVVECIATGAHVTLIDGLITDCAAEVARRKDQEGWFDVSTLKEPYRLEGKKTLGYELAEQLNWELPDVVLYPTGGGTGLVGMWKAFAEMEQLGWISSHRPRMVSVQAAGCRPIVTAHAQNARFAAEHLNASTKAAGLRVPKPIGDFLVLDAIRASKGTAIAVTDQEMIDAARGVGAAEGLFLAPEGAACCVALSKLRQSGWIQPHEAVVVFNTGAGLKALECFAELEGMASCPLERQRSS